MSIRFAQMTASCLKSLNPCSRRCLKVLFGRITISPRSPSGSPIRVETVQPSSLLEMTAELTQHGYLVGHLPRESDIHPADMAIDRQFSIEPAFHQRGEISQIELPDDAGQTEIKMRLQERRDRVIRDLAGPKGLNLDAHWT
jgi:hypothetical protein